MKKKIMTIGILFLIVAMVFMAILPSVRAEEILNESTIIKGEDWEAYEVWSNGNTVWTVEIHSTEPIDIRMMDEDNFYHFERDESFKSFQKANVDDCTSKTYTVNLPEGTWYITLDNRDNYYDSDVSIKVTAEYVDDNEDNDDNGNETPSFEIIMFITGLSIVIATILINKRQKRKV